MKRLTEYQSLLLDFTPKPIRTDREYRRALAFVERHMQPRPPKAEADLLELLSTLVADYEAKMFSEPQVAPGEMLDHLIQARGVTKAETARATGIPRAAITSAIFGNRGISKSNAVRLAAYFGVTPVMFLPAINTAD
ncbi:MAG TPA: helix-turn-helix domain-containing protein [Pirellulales bacterium]|jgi:HTH-type transcriptional regulator/antitoxin HigA